MKIRFNRGQGLINAILVLAIIVFAGGILYFSFFSPAKKPEKAKTPEFAPSIKEPTKEPIKEETIKLKEVVPKEKTEEKSACNCESGQYCVYNQCWKENAADLFKEIFGDKINAIATESSNDYTKPIIGPWYWDSAWMTECGSMIKKVNELIQGKSTNYEKSLSISNWVTNSRKYGMIPAGKVQNICDLFRADTGVCLDAAYLTTAMFRLAGIPARVVFPATELAHAYTEFYSNGEWWAIDTTFGGGEPPAFRSTTLLNTFKYIEFKKPREIIKSDSLNEFHYFLADGFFLITEIKKDLVSATSNSFEKSEWGELTYIKPLYISNSLVINKIEVDAKDITCTSYNCVRAVGMNTKIPLGISPILIKAKKMLHFAGGEKVEGMDEFVSEYDLRDVYYKTTPLPPGKYRFGYKDPHNPTRFVVYVDIEIKSGERKVITPESLIKSGDITNEQFDNFINYLKNVR